MQSQLRDIVEIAALVLAGWIVIVWISGAVYLMASYLESAGRLPRRSFRSTVRWILREIWLVAWTQPLLPVFQFLGQRMGTGGGEVPIVLIHGYFQNRVDFLYLARRLKKAGCGPLFAFNFFWPQDLEKSSMQAEEFVQHVRALTGAPRVDMLTHSTGGLFALDIISRRPEAVRSAVVIAIPASGVPWRGPVLGRSGSQLRTTATHWSQRQDAVDGHIVLSIYSSHDNLVHPVSTSRLKGDSARNLEIEGPGHLSVLFDERVGDAVVEFLMPEG